VLTIAIGVLLAVLIGLVIASYNRLVRARNRVREAWSGIDVQLRRRASLIPNLVEVVRAYARHERDTFEHVTRARNALQHAGGPGAAAGAHHALSQALGRLLAVAEAYPQLRASESFSRLHDELSDTEEKIAFARRFYNRTVLDYNTRIEVFPTVMIARAFTFRGAEFFEIDEEGRAEVRAALAPA
jgi:LemA protein